MSSMFQQIAGDVKKDVKEARWTLGLYGVLSIVFGVLIVVWPGISLYTLVILFGAFALVRGVIGLVAAVRSGSTPGRGWLVFNSVLGIAVGAIVFWRTDMSALALLYVIGAYAIALGVITLFGSYVLPFQSSADRILLALSGCVGIVFGIVMFAKPGDGAIVLLALIAAYAIILGITELGVAIGAESLFKRAVRDSLPQAPKPQPTHS
jgi:uncharacterized membrane protein HdeD (DUF308 family)